MRLDKYANIVNPVKRIAPKEDFLVCLIPVFGVVEECHFVTSLRTTSPLLVTRDGKLWMLNPLSRAMCDSTCRNGTILKAQSVTCQIEGLPRCVHGSTPKILRNIRPLAPPDGDSLFLFWSASQSLCRSPSLRQPTTYHARSNQ